MNEFTPEQEEYLKTLPTLQEEYNERTKMIAKTINILRLYTLYM